MRRRWAVVLGVGLLAAGPALAAGDRSGAAREGPVGFGLRPQGPLRMPFLTPRFTGGSILSAGASRWRVDLSHANSFLSSPGVISPLRPDPDLADIVARARFVRGATGKTVHYIDGETTRLDLQYAVGLPGGWEVGIDLPIVRHGGGFLDATIANFHDVIGVSNDARDSAPQDAAAAVLLSRDGDIILTGGDFPSADLGDVTLSARFRLPWDGDHFRWNVQALVQLPTGDEETLAGNGNIDYGPALSLLWRFGRSRFTFGIGYTVLGDLDTAPDLPIEDVVTTTAGYQVQLSSRVFLLGQLLHSTSPYRGLGDDAIGDPTGIGALGPRIVLGRGWVLDAAFIEDVLVQDSDLDAGVLVSLQWRPAD